jgi:uncharacterized membrane protein
MADQAARIELLKSVPLFHDLSEADLRSLADHCTERAVPAGSLIFNRGDPGSAMYLIVRGQVNIHLPDQGSRRMSLNDLAGGEYFGEVALFDEQPRTASASATTEVALLEVSRSALLSTLRERPAAALSMLRTMASRVRNMSEMLEEQVSKNAVAEFEQRLTWSDRLANKVAGINGSWAFILCLVAMTSVWVVVNSPGLVAWPAFDPYPFVFFNLVLAVLVGLQGPLILMSQNRESAKERAKAEMDFAVNLKNEVNIQTLVRELGEFRLETIQRVELIEQAVHIAGKTASA